MRSTLGAEPPPSNSEASQARTTVFASSGPDDPRSHGEDLGVVALAGALGRERVVGEGGPHARDLVGADGHPDARAAHEDGALEAAGRHLLRHGEGDIRVEDGSTLEGSEVLDGVLPVGEELLDDLLEVVSCLIAADGDLHSNPRKLRGLGLATTLPREPAALAIAHTASNSSRCCVNNNSLDIPSLTGEQEPRPGESATVPSLEAQGV